MLDKQLLSDAAFLRGDLQQLHIIEFYPELIRQLFADLAAAAAELTAYGNDRSHDKAPPIYELITDLKFRRSVTVLHYYNILYLICTPIFKKIMHKYIPILLCILHNHSRFGGLFIVQYSYYI